MALVDGTEVLLFDKDVMNIEELDDQAVFSWDSHEGEFVSTSIVRNHKDEEIEFLVIVTASGNRLTCSVDQGFTTHDFSTISAEYLHEGDHLLACTKSGKQREDEILEIIPISEGTLGTSLVENVPSHGFAVSMGGSLFVFTQ